MNTTYLTIEDFEARIPKHRLDQMMENDPALLDQIEKPAIAMVRDHLHNRYEVDAIFNKTGNQRHQNVVRWTLNIAIYYLAERIPDAFIPERVQNDFNDTKDDLEAIHDGRKTAELPQKKTSEGAVTSFRWGSAKKRSH